MIRYAPHFHRLFILVASVLLASCPRSGPEVPLPAVQGEHLLRFVQISDTQIVDEESPARLIKFAPLTKSAWRPEEAYGIHTLDATLRAINDRQVAKGGEHFPIDFVIATGDLTDGCQHNELRWFIDTMDGGVVRADSGSPDGEHREQDAEDNPKLAYDAEGLDPSIPWYTVFGNHDGLATGVFGIDRSAEDPDAWTAPLLGPVAALIGLHNFTPQLNAMDPTSSLSPAIIRGSVEAGDPETLRLPVLDLIAGPIVVDHERRFSSRQAFIEEHFETTSEPDGHGFTGENWQSGRTRYSVRPNENAPVRLVVMDTVAPDPIPGLPAHYGVMTREQFDNFLKYEIDAAEKAGEWVLIASHHPSEDFDIPYPGEDVLKTAEFRAYLASCSNVIAHICGHSHRNFVQRIDGDNPYYEIETGSIIDYPQEGRILDIYYDEDEGVMTLKSTMISHMENPTRLSEESFRRAEIDAENHSRKAEDALALKAALGDVGIAHWPTTLPTKEESHGRHSDRDFQASFSRRLPPSGKAR